MPDQNEASFREVLDISVDLAKFKEQMSQVARIYSDACCSSKARVFRTPQLSAPRAIRGGHVPAAGAWLDVLLVDPGHLAFPGMQR